jgi:MFS family permease
VPNALALVQAVIGPVISSVSDTFQVRKPILVASCAVALIGLGIAPGSTSINRLIGAQALIGVGLAALPLGYVVPSEILPRRWRPSNNSLYYVLSPTFESDIFN